MSWIDCLERKSDIGALSVIEWGEWKENCHALWLLLKSKDNMAFQQSLARWVKEGGVKTSYFYACVKNLRRVNYIVVLMRE